MEEKESRRNAVVVKIMAMGGRHGAAANAEEEPMDESESSEDSKKESQEEVNYMTAPAKCRDCEYFASPSSCEKVDGTISKNGYCHLFEIESGEKDAE